MPRGIPRISFLTIRRTCRWLTLGLSEAILTTLSQWPYVKIVVVEDHAMVRGFVLRVCEDAFAHPQVHEATRADEALEIVRKVQPDLILLDLELPDKDGLDLLPDLRVAAKFARVIILSSHIDAFSVSRVQRAGVEGFVDKNEQSPDALCEAMRQVMAGKRVYTTIVTKAQAALRADPKGFTKVLSDREIEVLRLIGDGMNDEAVAERLKISALTARNYRRKVMSKLDIHSTPELLRYAVEKGFSRLSSRSTWKLSIRCRRRSAWRTISAKRVSCAGPPAPASNACAASLSLRALMSPAWERSRCA